MSEEKVDRRDYTKAIAGTIAGLVVGGAAGYLLKPAAPGEIITETVRETVAGPGVTTTVTATPAPTKPEYLFYFCTVNPGQFEFYVPIIFGAETAGKQMGVDVKVVYPDVFGLEKFVDTVEGAIAARPDAMAVCCHYPESLEDSFAKCVELGIPICTYDNRDPRPPGERLPDIGFVGMELEGQIEVGRACARRALQEFPNGPKRVVVPEFSPGAVYSTARRSGVKEVVQEKYPDVPVDFLTISRESETEAYETMRAYLEKYPETDYMAHMGPMGAHPGLKLVEERGLVGKVKVTAVDVTPAIMKAIEDEVLICTVTQQPCFQGYIPIIWLYSHLKWGFIPPDLTPTGPAVIDKDNLNLIKQQLDTTGGA